MRNVENETTRSVATVPESPLSTSSVSPSIAHVPEARSTASANAPAGFASAMLTPGFTVDVNGIGLLPLPPKSPGIVRVPPGFAVASWLPIHVPASGSEMSVDWLKVLVGDTVHA